MVKINGPPPAFLIMSGITLKPYIDESRQAYAFSSEEAAAVFAKKAGRAHIRRLEQGMTEEVRALLDEGVSEEFLIKLGLEYKYLTWYLTGKMGYEQMKEELATAIKQLAKRQMTWFRKDPEIVWLDMTGDPIAQAEPYIESFLAGKPE